MQFAKRSDNTVGFQKASLYMKGRTTMSFLKVARGFVRVGLVVAVAGLMALSVASEAGASAAQKAELAVKGGQGACAVTQITTDGDGYTGVYESIYHESGDVTGPSPDRYLNSNGMGKQIVEGIKREADYVTTLLSGETVVIQLDKGGACVISFFHEVEGKIGLYQVIVHADRSLGGPNPDFVSDAVMRDIVSKAAGLIKVK